jgi:hypothetical protein
MRRELPQSGDNGSTGTDDSLPVNVQGAVPILWLQVAMLLLDFSVWVYIATRLAEALS